MILLFFTFYRILYLYLLILLLFVFDAFHPYLNQNKSIFNAKGLYPFRFEVEYINLISFSYSHDLDFVPNILIKNPSLL